MSEFLQLLSFLWTNRQQLLQLLQALPDILEAAGESMETAGEGAIEASKFIRGNGTGGLNARSVFISGASAIEDIRSQVDNVKEEIDSLADNPFFFTVKAPMQDFGKRVDDVSTEIQKIADNLTDVSSALNSSGLGLKKLGQQLVAAGTQFKQVS